VRTTSITFTASPSRRHGGDPLRYPGLIPLLAATLLLLVLSHQVTAANVPKSLWVAPDGTDTGPGTKSQPLATLEGARDRLRELRRDQPLPKDGVTIWIRGGAYLRTSSFELTPEDSGTVRPPIVYRGVPGETATANLRAQGITDLGHLQSRGFGRSTAPSHLELFYDGRPATLARWPNEGQWTTIEGIPQDAARGDDHGGKIGDLPAGFRIGTPRPFQWQPSTNLWVHGYWAWDWANSYERVANLDPDQRLVRTAPPHGLYGFRPGQRFYFVNVLEELDVPGEYYVDSTSDLLYFWEPIAAPGREAIVSILETPIIQARDVSYVSFRGLHLQTGRGHGVEINGGTRVEIVGCQLRNLGNHGVVIRNGADHQVLSCNIFDTGDGGVVASGGDRQTLTSAHHLVENNHFRGQGRWSKCYVPAIEFTGVGLIARHNLIHDHPHCAILFNGNEHRIEFNEIHHVALETGDVGAIYTGRDWTYRGNRIVHNYIHDTGGVGMGSMGVYMDDCVSGTEIYGNIFRKVQRAVFLGGGRDHLVENNLFLDCHPAVAIDGRGLDQSPVWSNMVYRTMKERLTAVPSQLYRERYPTLTALDPHYASNQGVPPENNVIRHNLSVGGEWLTVGWHATPNMILAENNLVDRDPLFVDPAALDYRLQPNSPALELGFQPLPFDRIGLYNSEARRELQRPGPR